jgi:hypothetical protein
MSEPFDLLQESVAWVAERTDLVALSHTLSFGFTAESDRSLQAFLERYVETTDCDELSYSAFHEWFEPTFEFIPPRQVRLEGS